MESEKLLSSKDQQASAYSRSMESPSYRKSRWARLFHVALAFLIFGYTIYSFHRLSGAIDTYSYHSLDCHGHHREHHHHHNHGPHKGHHGHHGHQPSNGGDNDNTNDDDNNPRCSPKPIPTDIEFCPQAPSWRPRPDAKIDEKYSYLMSEDFFRSAIEKFSGAIQIPTISYDDMDFDPAKEPRFEIFEKLFEYYAKTFPQIHKKLQLERVNTYGLLFTWKGTDEDLKPLLLMAHNDVVPVPDETVDQWTHPPFSGHFDGQSVWGRGSNDCKNNVLSILSAIEELLDAGFKPKRTLLLSLGFDEEISGGRGAKHLAAKIEKDYGKSSLEAIIDEGSNVLKIGERNFAQVAVSEKGYVDIKYALKTHGGHSSRPPKHTGIGIMADLVTMIESLEDKPTLKANNPTFQYLQCFANYSGIVDDDFKKHFLQPEPPCQSYLKNVDEITQYSLRTTRAVDVIRGGLKVNALPELVELMINNRVSIDSNLNELENLYTKLGQAIAKKYGLGLKAFGKEIEKIEDPAFFLEISTVQALDPSPETPFIDSENFDLLSGVILNLMPDVIVTPNVMQGNSDTRHFWSLSKNIYRFTMSTPNGNHNLHTVNEHTEANSHLMLIKFFFQYIRAMNEV